GATAVRDDEGRIVALVFDAGTEPRTRTRVSLEHVRAQGALPIPVTTTSTVQRISLDAALAFHPEPALGMITHLGHTVARELDHDERRAIDRQLRAAPLGSFYATTASITREHGLRGEIELRADVRRRSAIGGAGIFVIACGAGVLGYRRSRRSAEAERADQVLAAEFDALGGDPR
ncbi:MAG: hypothetical protein IAG13_06990, partial [Deltaproteobacteria bacterium]|nr:hypothetical protein [Nannocystaceae bacterium]